MNIINLALRGVQFLSALVLMALTGDIISNNGNPSIINYGMFVAVFSMLSLFYLIPAAIKDSLAIHPIFPVALDALNTLFYFCGAVALAVKLSRNFCGEVDENNINASKRCAEGRASDAFLWFGFLAFTASTVLTGLGSRGSANMRPNGIRARGPAMSQV